jgi:flagellar biosynthesis GTPase FlhF
LEVGDKWFRRPYKVHSFNIDDKLKTYVCPKSIGKKCPICVYYAKMIKRGYSEKDMKDFKPKDREVYNIIDLKNPKDGIKLFEISPFLFGDLLDKDMADDLIFDQYGDFSDLQEGFTLRVRFDKTTAPGFTKPFLKASRIDYLKRKKKYPSTYYEQAHPLDEMLNVLSYEQLEAVLFNMDDEGVEEYKEEVEGSETEEEVDEVEDDIDDSQWDKKKKSGSKKKVEEEEPEEEEEVEEEEEPEVKKSKKKTTSKKKKTPEPEPEEEEEEEEEPEEEDEEEPEEEDDEDVEDEEEPEEEDEEEPEDGTCPHDYVFGEECDQHDECEECPVWDTCSDMKEELEKEKAKTKPKKKPSPKKVTKGKGKKK